MSDAARIAFGLCGLLGGTCGLIGFLFVAFGRRA